MLTTAARQADIYEIVPNLNGVAITKCRACGPRRREVPELDGHGVAYRAELGIGDDLPLQRPT